MHTKNGNNASNLHTHIRPGKHRLHLCIRFNIEVGSVSILKIQQNAHSLLSLVSRACAPHRGARGKCDLGASSTVEFRSLQHHYMEPSLHSDPSVPRRSSC